MKKFRRWLKASGLSQRDAGRKLGIGQMAVSYYVTGKGLPSIRAAYLIEKGTRGAVRLRDWIK